MSDIKGTGWGDDHDWIRGGTNQVGAAPAAFKASYYECKNCHEAFAHSYDLIPDIFENMKQVGISEHCPKLPIPTGETQS
jgi:hypothetical protein